MTHKNPLRALFFAGFLMATGGLFAESHCCTNKEPCCDDSVKCETRGFFGSFENLIIKPYFSQNNAYFQENPGSTDGQNAVPFDWGFDWSPRLEFGYLDDECNLGGRIRYWYFDGSEKMHATNDGGDISSMFADDSVSDTIGLDGVSAATLKHSVEMHVADFEAMMKRRRCTYSIGLRYANMDQKYTGQEDGSDVPEIVVKHSFKGFGLTAAAEFRQHVWCDISLFTKARGSLLFGDSEFAAWNADDDDGNPSRISGSNDNDLIAVGELQVGFDWRYCFCDQYLAVVSFSVEGQYWANAGTGAPINNAVYDEGNYQNGHIQEATMGFLGFSLGGSIYF